MENDRQPAARQNIEDLRAERGGVAHDAVFAATQDGQICRRRSRGRS